MKKINTVIFGATGSIGKSALSIISQKNQFINIEGMTCNSNLKKLCKIADLHGVKKIGFNENAVANLKKVKLNKYEVYNNIKNFDKIISDKTDIIIFGINGLSSFDLLIKILKSGKKVGIANKECIISLGEKFNKIAKKYSTEIVPLDSEHNSIYHLLHNEYGKFNSITITATGGPFIDFKTKQLKKLLLLKQSTSYMENGKKYL